MNTEPVEVRPTTKVFSNKFLSINKHVDINCCIFSIKKSFIVQASAVGQRHNSDLPEWDGLCDFVIVIPKTKKIYLINTKNNAVSRN